jgi:hypothetical protein
MAKHSLSACRAEIKINPGKFYVYILSKPDGSPFYVGCGRGSRIAQHVAASRHNKTHPKSRMIRSILRSGETVQYQIESWHLDYRLALAREVELIRSLGRRDLGAGPLLNLTDGGDGVSALTAEARKKQSDAMTRRWGDPKERERLSGSMKRAFYDSPDRQQNAKEHAGAIMRTALARRREDPAWQKELDKRRLSAQCTAEGRAKRAAISKAMWSDPDTRARILRRCEESRQRRAAIKLTNNQSLR